MKYLMLLLLLAGYRVNAADCRRCARLENILQAGEIVGATDYLQRFKMSKDPVVAQQEANLIMRIMAKYRRQDNDGFLGELWYGIYVDEGRPYMTNALETQVSEADRQALRRLYAIIGRSWMRGNG